MKNKKWAAVAVLSFALIMTGCRTTSDIDTQEINGKSEVVEEVTKAATEEATEVTSETATEDNTENQAAATKSFEEFLAGNNTISFDYYMNNNYEEDNFSSEEAIKRLDTEKTYTLSELWDELSASLSAGSLEKMEYTYIDCGNDGVAEMVLRIHGSFIEEKSSIAYIIKEIDSKLQVIFAYSEWSRSSTSINEYGFIKEGGSLGAANRGFNTAYINADGKYNYGFFQEDCLDIDQFAMNNEHTDYDLTDLDGRICICSMRLAPYSEEITEPVAYSYNVYNRETHESMDIPDLYTDSPYKSVMDSFSELEFLPMNEFIHKENEILKSIGVTEQIMNGKTPEYTEIVFE